MTATVYKKWTEVYSSLVSPITSTRFMEKGQMTPEEFVEAGDKLVARCPTWKWHGAPAGKEGVHKLMPQDKRYIVMTGARCEKRAADLQQDGGGEEDVEDGWTNTYIDHKPAAAEEAPDMAVGSGGQGEEAEIDDDDVPEMGEDGDGCGFVEEEEDPAAVVSDGIVACRKYDIHLLYDNYEYTPRVYLQGYDESGRPLTNQQMYEDIYTDYAEKTATIEAHPYTDASMVSIHPCRHAETMKRMIDKLREAHEAKEASASGPGASSSSSSSSASPQKGAEFGVPTDMALFLFLKFISSVIPTIDYDYTTTVDLK